MRGSKSSNPSDKRDFVDVGKEMPAHAVIETTKAKDHPQIAVWVLLGGALIIGLVLRLAVVNFDLPYIYDWDEPIFVRRAMHLLSRGSLNPGWFGHPGTTVIYVNALIYVAVLEIGMYLGWFANLKEMQDYFYQDPTIFFLLPRIFSALAGTAVIAATFFAARTTFNAAAAVAAALLVAVLPSQVYYAHIIRTETLTALFVLLASWQAAMIVDGRKLQHYLWAGAMIGFAVATKYPAILVAALVPFAHCLSGRGLISDWWKIVLAGAMALAAAFLASPYLFLDFPTVLSDLRAEMHPAHLSATGEGFLPDLWWYAAKLVGEFGFVLFALSIVGAYALFHEWNKPGFVLLSFVFLYLLFIAALSLRWERYLVPVAPFIAIFAAGGASFLIQRLASHWSRLAQGLCLLAFAIVASAPFAWINLKLMGKDTRTIAREWILSHVERGAPLAMEVYTPQLPRGAYQLFETRRGALVPIQSSFENVIPSHNFLGNLKSIEDLKRLGVQYIVLSSGFQRFQNEADRYPRQVRNYERLFTFSQVIYDAKPGHEAAKGPQIRVLKVDHEALGRYLDDRAQCLSEAKKPARSC